MKHSAFRQWMGGLGLAAALLLVLVPGVGRMAHAADGHALTEQAHGANASPATHHGRPDGDMGRAAIGDPDCDYCPLLASMATAADVAFITARAPSAGPPASPSASPRLRWRHPWGLGSRGPP